MGLLGRHEGGSGRPGLGAVEVIWMGTDVDREYVCSNLRDGVQVEYRFAADDEE